MNEDDDALGYDEQGETYTVDSATGRIQFIKDSPGYIIRRTAFTAEGIDIDKIETEEELYRMDHRCRHVIFEVVRARIMSRRSSHLENEMVKAILLGDIPKADAIAARLRRRRAGRLRIVRESEETSNKTTHKKEEQ